MDRIPLKCSSLSRVLHVLASMLLIVVLLFTSKLKAQEFDYRTTFSDAEYYFLFQDYKEALPLYLKLYDENPTNSNLQYRIGLCYFNIPGLKHQAIPFLEKAVENINIGYQEGSYKETGAPSNSYFYLGEAYRVSGLLDQAIKSYDIFRSLLDTKDVFNLDYITQQIRACELAKIMMSFSHDVKKEPLLFFEETKYCFNPSISFDGLTAVFTVQEKFYDAIYIVKKEGDKWGLPINITLDIAVEGEVYSTSINANATEIFIYKNDKGIGNLYSSILIGDKWQPAKKLGKNISTRNWETHASISPDGKTLFFTSNRKGGFGGLDIYMSKLEPAGEWGEPVNLGPSINTPQNEEAPFLMGDGLTLYFASQGHNSMGGYDIYFSQQIDDSYWSTPINMGYPINSTDDEIFYFPVEKNVGLMAFVQKNNPNSRIIHTITKGIQSEVSEVKVVGEIALADNYEIRGDDFIVTIYNLDSDSLINQVIPADLTGKFELLLKPGSYKFVAEGKGYSQDKSNVIIPKDYSQPTYPISFKLVPISVTSGEYVVILSILFGFDNAELSRDATFEVEKVYNLLQKYPALTIEVSGHTDCKGSAAYNKRLSLRRAQAVIDFLIEKGISKERLLARAASDYENIAENYNPDGTDNPEGRSLNRRASIKVLNSDANVRIEEDLSIPEHLKPREQNYTILLAPINKVVDVKALKDLKTKAKIEPQKFVGSDRQFAHVVGSYGFKSQAIGLLNYCIDNGFPLATIIGEDDLKMQLSIPPVPTRKVAQDDERVYTIQVYAHPDPVEDYSMFKGLAVKEVKGKDGMYRYIYGEYRGKNAALQELEKIQNLGFADAFVMNINRYQE